MTSQERKLNSQGTYLCQSVIERKQTKSYVGNFRSFIFLLILEHEIPNERGI